MTETAIALLALARQLTVGLVWQEAIADAIDHAMIVSDNNKDQTTKELLARPDVAQSLIYPFHAAAEMTEQEVDKAWNLARANADIPTVQLNAIKRLIRRSATKATPKLQEILSAGEIDDDAVFALQNSLALRAEYAVEHATKTATTLAAIETAPKGHKKVWRSTDHPTRCSHCAALDGTTISLKATFDKEAGDSKLGSLGKLLGPPRHPNCRCTLEIVDPKA